MACVSGGTNVKESALKKKRLGGGRLHRGEDGAPMTSA